MSPPSRPGCPSSPAQRCPRRPRSPRPRRAGRPPGHRFGNDDLYAGTATAHERRGGRVLRRDVHDMVLAQRGRVQVPNRRRGGVRPTGHQQGRLGQPVHRMKSLRAETGRAEGVCEPLQGRGTHRFGTAHGRRQVGQIERRALLHGAVFDTQLVSKVRRRGDRAADSGEGFQPPQGSLDESGGRHEERSAPDEERFEHPADETHVVMERQPEHADRLVVSIPHPTDDLEVVEQVAVRQHNAFR